MSEYIKQLRAFIAPFHDATAWTLIAICGGGVALFDPAMAETLAEMVLFFGVFAGLGVIISRKVFPQVKLSDHVGAALRDPVGAGLVAAGLFVFLGLLILSIVLWAPKL